MAAGVSKSVAAIAKLRRWDEDDARVVLEAAQRSGLTLGSYATSVGIDPQRLYRWSRALVGREQHEAAPIRFEEVVVPRTGESSIEVVHPSGCVIRLGASFEESALRRVLAVMAELEREC